MAAASGNRKVLAILNKRLRNLRKKLKQILQIETSISQGRSINKQQQEVLSTKSSVLILIEELENLLPVITAALEEDCNLAVQISATPDIGIDSDLVSDKSVIGNDDKDLVLEKSSIADSDNFPTPPISEISSSVTEAETFAAPLLDSAVAESDGAEEPKEELCLNEDAPLQDETLCLNEDAPFLQDETPLVNQSTPTEEAKPQEREKTPASVVEDDWVEVKSKKSLKSDHKIDQNKERFRRNRQWRDGRGYRNNNSNGHNNDQRGYRNNDDDRVRNNSRTRGRITPNHAPSAPTASGSSTPKHVPVEAEAAPKAEAKPVVFVIQGSHASSNVDGASSYLHVVNKKTVV